VVANGEATTPACSAQPLAASEPIAIQDVGRVDTGREYQPFRVAEQLALMAFHFLAAIDAALAPMPFVFTDWLSMTLALGSGSRPRWTRSV
jgi:hypothetical protein